MKESQKVLLPRYNLIKVLSVIAVTMSYSAAAHISLKGEFTQGSMIVGETLPNSTVTLNNKPLKISKDGDFAFGFSRDDKTNYQLSVTLPDGKVIQREFTPSQREYNIQRIEGIKKSIMKPNPKAVARAKKDSADVKAARAVVSDQTYFSTPFIKPMEGRVTGVYGSQRYYNGVPKSPHYGIDYAGKVGHPVKAPASGTVTMWVPDMFYSGGTMIIDHGHGINSTFLHLSQSYVAVGDKVKQGEVVAAVGKSGRATGPHLDWRVNWFNVRLDPALVLKIHQ